MARTNEQIKQALEAKLDQARYFRDQLEMHWLDQRLNAAYFAACISALRSVQVYVREALNERGLLPKDCTANDAWGRLHGDLTRGLPAEIRRVGSWIRSVANGDIHRSPAEMLTEIFGGHFDPAYFDPGYWSFEYWGMSEATTVANREGEKRNPLEACTEGIQYGELLAAEFLT